MKNQIRSVFQQFTYIFPLPLLIRLTGQKLFLPFYHSVESAVSLRHIRHLYSPRSAQQFEKDLDFFLKYFQPVSLEEIFDSVKNQKPFSNNSFHISFDDGLKEVHEIAYPILKRKGIPATIFLNSAFVDNRNLFFRYKASLIIDFLEGKKMSSSLQSLMSLKPFKGSTREKILSINYQNKHLLDEIAEALDIDFLDFLKKNKPYLTTPQIQEMQKEGFTFGAHSIDHPLYAELAVEEQLRQTAESIDFTKQYFPEKIKTFSFPFTDFEVSKKFFQTVEEKNIADLTFGCAGLKKQTLPFHLQRVPMETSTLSADRIVASEYFYYIVKSFFGKNKMKQP